MKKVFIGLALFAGLALTAVSCEAESTAEIEETFSPDPDKLCPPGKTCED